MSVTDAMIVAGGRGTRLRPLTEQTPKPLVPFCGAPFLVGVLARLADAGVTRAFLVVGDDTAPFEVLRGPAAAVGIELVMVPEPEPLDTAGGVRSAVDEVDGPFLVLNGDVLTDVDYRTVADHHLSTGADATLVLTRVDDTSTFGVCVRDGTRITRFVEKPPPGTLPGQDAINAGTYVVDPEVLRRFPNGRLSFERAVFPGILDAGGHLDSVVWEGVWADLGTPDRYRRGTALALDRALRWPTVDVVPDRGDGVRVADDAEVDEDATLVGPCLVLAGSRVGAGATVGPHVVLGVDTVVGAATTVVASVLFDGARVGDGVSVTGLLAGYGAVVEPGATVGGDVVLGDHQVVGAGAVLSDGARQPAP